MPKTFTLTIALGNDAMQSCGDIASALERIADRLRDVYGAEVEPDDGQGDRVRDTNGSTVGHWSVSA